MADRLDYTLDAMAIEAAMLALGDAAQPYVNAAAHVTADAIASEATTRLRRQLGPTQRPTASRPDLGQGLTLSGIVVQAAEDGFGYLVLSGREPFPNVPLWLDRGTQHGNHEAPRPYFLVAVLLEEAPHEQRIADAMQQAIDDQGLGA